MSNLRLYSMVLGGSTVVAVGLSWLLRAGRKTPEAREQERRLRISRTGRIIDGTLIDVHEVAGEPAPIQLLIYQYDVAGVSYECSQDVSHLAAFVDVQTCRLGLPASIKYDPHNPANSVLVSEEWSGLRKYPTIVQGIHRVSQSS